MAKEEGLELGKEKGLELGIKEGMEKGMEKGLEKGLENGTQIGNFLGKLTKDVDFIHTLLSEKVAVSDIVKYTKIEQSFILDFKKNISDEKYNTIIEYLNDLKNISNKKNFTLLQLKSAIAIFLLKYHFSEKALSQTLKLSPKKVKTLKTKLSKK